MSPQTPWQRRLPAHSATRALPQTMFSVAIAGTGSGSVQRHLAVFFFHVESNFSHGCFLHSVRRLQRGRQCFL